MKYGPQNEPIIVDVLTERYNKYMLFANWEVRIGKTVPEVLSTARGTRLVNDIFIFSLKLN